MCWSETTWTKNIFNETAQENYCLSRLSHYPLEAAWKKTETAVSSDIQFCISIVVKIIIILHLRLSLFSGIITKFVERD